LSGKKRKAARRERRGGCGPDGANEAGEKTGLHQRPSKKQTSVWAGRTGQCLTLAARIGTQLDLDASYKQTDPGGSAGQTCAHQSKAGGWPRPREKKLGGWFLRLDLQNFHGWQQSNLKKASPRSRGALGLGAGIIGGRKTHVEERVNRGSMCFWGRKA